MVWTQNKGRQRQPYRVAPKPSDTPDVHRADAVGPQHTAQDQCPTHLQVSRGHPSSQHRKTVTKEPKWCFDTGSELARPQGPADESLVHRREHPLHHVEKVRAVTQQLDAAPAQGEGRAPREKEGPPREGGLAVPRTEPHLQGPASGHCVTCPQGPLNLSCLSRVTNLASRCAHNTSILLVSVIKMHLY